MDRLPLLPIDEGARCFVCGAANKHGLGVRFFLAGDQVEGEWVAHEAVEGWPGILHGGAIMALLDDAAAWAMIALANETGFTRSLEAKFVRPVPLGAPVRAVGRVIEVGDRAGVFQAEVLLPDGQPAASARVEFAFVNEAVLVRMQGGKPLSADLAGWMRAPRAERRALLEERCRRLSTTS